MTTVAVGGDAFARHLAEHTASAPGDPVTEAHKITKVRATCQEQDHRDWNTALKCLAVAAADWVQIRIGQAATWFPTPDDILLVAHRWWSEWRDKC